MAGRRAELTQFGIFVKFPGNQQSTAPQADTSQFEKTLGCSAY
jgi:hypothetical protein